MDADDLQVKALADKAKKFTKQKKQLQARQDMSKAHPAQTELICTQWNQCHKPIDTLRLKAIHFYESLGMICNAI